MNPDYYCWIPNIECIDVAKHFSFCLGNVIKYVIRGGRKNSDGSEFNVLSQIEDL